MSNVNKKELENQIVYLIKCSLHAINPEKNIVSKMDFKMLYKFSKFHSIQVLMYRAIENSGIIEELTEENDIQVLKKWKKEKEQSIYQKILMDIEREKHLKFMEEKNIWYMPLKGLFLKDYYPEEEMRQMTDNDILFDKQYSKEIYEYMTEKGYEAVEYNESNHDEYLKKPVYNFEMHKDLFSEEHDIRWQKYYANTKSMLIKDEGNDFGYYFSDEDFYIYNILHAYNHYIKRGTGIRTVIDFYLYLNKNQDKMDFDYIEKECGKLGVTDFEKTIRALSSKIFANSGKDYSENLTEEERDMFDYIFFAGTFGTRENYINYKMSVAKNNGGEVTKKTRIKYIFSRMFPGMDFFEKYYPIVYRHKWLLPFAYIYRIFKGIFVKNKTTMEELTIITKKNAKEGGEKHER